MQREKNLETMLTISTGFLVLFLVYKIEYFLLVSLVLGLTGMFSDFLSGKISWLWNKLAEVLGMVMPKIILGIVFYFFLFPIALLSRIGGKDSLMLKKGKKSHYVERNLTYSKADLENSW